MKTDIPEDNFSVVGSSFQMLGAATEKAHFPRFSLVVSWDLTMDLLDRWIH